MTDYGFEMARAVHDPKGLAALKLAAKGSGEGAALREAAEEFEGLFVQQMLAAMRKTVPEDGLFSSSEESTFRAMADQQLAQDLARSGDFGIAESLVRQLGREGEGGGAAQSSDPGALGAQVRLHQARKGAEKA
jgi:flagellar protein FlgJ